MPKVQLIDLERWKLRVIFAGRKRGLPFTAIFKVHNETEHNNVPPVRAIISGSGSITENISLYVEHHNQHLSSTHETYLQYTQHFFGVIENINQCSKLPPNAMLVTSDITSAYHNIPQEDGSDCLREALWKKEK